MLAHDGIEVHDDWTATPKSINEFHAMRSLLYAFFVKHLLGSVSGNGLRRRRRPVETSRVITFFLIDGFTPYAVLEIVTTGITRYDSFGFSI